MRYCTASTLRKKSVTGSALLLLALLILVICINADQALNQTFNESGVLWNNEGLYIDFDMFNDSNSINLNDTNLTDFNITIINTTNISLINFSNDTVVLFLDNLSMIIVPVDANSTNISSQAFSNASLNLSLNNSNNSENLSKENFSTNNTSDSANISVNLTNQTTNLTNLTLSKPANITNVSINLTNQTNITNITNITEPDFNITLNRNGYSLGDTLSLMITPANATAVVYLTDSDNITSQINFTSYLLEKVGGHSLNASLYLHNFSKEFIIEFNVSQGTIVYETTIANIYGSRRESLKVRLEYPESLRNLVDDVRDDDPQIAGRKRKLLNNFVDNKLDSTVLFEDKPFKSIEFNDLELKNGTLNLGIEELNESPFVQSYAVDPEKMNFTNATVTVTAKGGSLYKCRQWNFSEKKCYGTWQLLKDNLIPGRNYTFTLTAYDPAFGEVISDCVAEDEAPKGSFNSACDNTTGAFLESDDSLAESHSFTQDTYGGVRSQSVNSSEDYCANITEVFLCYEWWHDGIYETYDCSVSVDADAGDNYSDVLTSCPGNTSNPGMSCINVTQAEDWSCENFFGENGTRASAKSELSINQTANQTAYWDALFFNVTYDIIDDPPVVNLSYPDNMQVISSTNNVTFNVTASDDHGLYNCTLWTNITGAWAANDTRQMSGNDDYASWNISSLNDSAYIWNAYCCDAGACSWNSRNYTFFITYSDIYHVFYGNVSVLKLFGRDKDTLLDFGPGDFLNVYAADYDSNISWTSLQAIGRTTLNSASSNDFEEIDRLFNITNESNNINLTYSLEGSNARNTRSFRIFSNSIGQVPIVNSTNTSAFVTGILWDYSDSTDEEFNYTEKEDIVFITVSNQSNIGKFGFYDYELKVPEALNTYTGENDNVFFYYEII